MKKKGFTLMEILISITGFFLLMTIVINAYIGIIKFRYAFQARSSLLETTYYMFEKINLLLRDFTIDYEEYFNRYKIGCDALPFNWSGGINGYCDIFSAYGNANPYLVNTGAHAFYFCSSYTGYTSSTERVVYQPLLQTGCALSGRQSFGQYALNFKDFKENADFSPSVVNDSDDTDLGQGPDSISNATGVQELYLISQDAQHRVLLRRALVESGDWDGNGIVSGDYEKLYTLQILKLKGFDAGNNHNFSTTTSSGVYDGNVDTWACDYSQGFICGGTSIGNVYSGYRLPLNVNDGWVNLFDRSITVSDRNITIYPTKNPQLSWMESTYQINPYFVISLQTKLYGGVWQKKLNESIKDFQFTLQTTFDTKNYYK